jgi:hypothetical protein
MGIPLYSAICLSPFRGADAPVFRDCLCPVFSISDCSGRCRSAVWRPQCPLISGEAPAAPHPGRLLPDSPLSLQAVLLFCKMYLAMSVPKPPSSLKVPGISPVLRLYAHFQRVAHTFQVLPDWSCSDFVPHHACICAIVLTLCPNKNVPRFSETHF